jgi:hypothetical protein
MSNRLIALQIVRETRNPKQLCRIRVHEDDASYIDEEARRCTRSKIHQLEHVLKVYRACVETLHGVDNPDVIRRALEYWKRNGAPGL